MLNPTPLNPQIDSESSNYPQDTFKPEDTSKPEDTILLDKPETWENLDKETLSHVSEAIKKIGEREIDYDFLSNLDLAEKKDRLSN